MSGGGMHPPAELTSALEMVLGRDHCLPGHAEARYRDDETGAVAGQPALILRPADAGAVSAILRLCAEHRWPVVVQGGRTGLVRGATPRDGEMVISTERMRAIAAVDAAGLTLEVGAGASLENVQETARAAGLRFGVDIGARGSCTIGGMIATNAGGHQVMRYGMMRANVLGLEAVMADGTILTSLRPMLKDNAGYDLKQLLIGTEGTIGVTTRALLRLRPAAAAPPVVSMVAVRSYEDAVRLLHLLERHCPGRLAAFEAIWPRFFHAACGILRSRTPFDAAPALAILVEVEEERGRLLDMLGEAMDSGLLADAVVAESVVQAKALWAIRDAIGRLMPSLPVAVPFDVSLAIGEIGRFVDDLDRRLLARWPDCVPLFFGHVADGNLHLALGLGREEDRREAKMLVYDLVRQAGGSISAEHGIGTLKKAYLHYSRSEAEIMLMRRLKHMFDPNNILNRGRVIG